jgi:hypothetical protein
LELLLEGFGGGVAACLEKPISPTACRRSSTFGPPVCAVPWAKSQTNTLREGIIKEET